MKKNVFSISTLVVSIIACLLFVCAQSLNAGNSKTFVYDKSKDGETVFLYDSLSCTLTPHLKYEFGYNENELLNSKKAYKWDSDEHKWEPYYLYTVTYVGNNQIQEFARWNSRKGNFSLDKQKAVFYTDGSQRVSTYISFKWNDKSRKWEVKNNYELEDYIALLVYQFEK